VKGAPWSVLDSTTGGTAKPDPQVSAIRHPKTRPFDRSRQGTLNAPGSAAYRMTGCLLCAPRIDPQKTRGALRVKARYRGEVPRSTASSSGTWRRLIVSLPRFQTDSRGPKTALPVLDGAKIAEKNIIWYDRVPAGSGGQQPSFRL
jgi:hypothetical protein